MDFSKLKLTENAAGVAITSNNPATRNAAQSGANASGPGQSGMKQGTVNAQAGQGLQSAGNTGLKKQSPVKTGTQVNAGGPTNIQSSYDATLSRVELVKMREAAKCDWRQELMEAANPNDDPNHPFVEVMPFNDFRMKEAQKMMAQAAKKDKAAAQTMGMQTEAAPIVAAAGKALMGVVKGTATAAKGAAKKAAIDGAKSLAKKGMEVATSGGQGTSEVPTYAAEAAMDYTTQKKKSGKAISKGKSKCGDMPVKNSDNTATPKENQKRREVNAMPDFRGFMGKKVVKGMETDAFSSK